MHILISIFENIIKLPFLLSVTSVTVLNVVIYNVSYCHFTALLHLVLNGFFNYSLKSIQFLLVQLLTTFTVYLLFNDLKYGVS